MELTKAENFTDWSQIPLVIGPEQVAKVMGVGKNVAYELFHSKGFPSMKVGRRWLVGRDAFKNWLEMANSKQSA